MSVNLNINILSNAFESQTKFTFWLLNMWRKYYPLKFIYMTLIFNVHMPLEDGN